MNFRPICSCCVIAVSFFGLQVAIAAVAGDPDEAVAIVNGVKITVADVQTKDPGPILQARNALFTAQKAAAEQFITDYLLEQQAKKETVTVEELLERHVNIAGGPEPSEEALRYYYDGLDVKEPLDAVRSKIIDLVRQRRIGRAKTEYIESLRREAKIDFVLAVPRVEISITDTPLRGQTNAAVKVVEYADYECPYCRQAEPVLQQIEKEYKEKIVLAYKDSPLPNHSYAQKAAEAAHCAGVQGKYWEYHDALFAKDALDIPVLKQHARSLNLDGDAFDTCLDSGAQTKRVEGGLDEAKKLALPGTPSFFINGKFIEGGSYDMIRQAIEEELATATK